MKENSKTVVGRKLVELMEAYPHLGTQRALGLRTGIAQSTIGRIRRGEVNATAENIRAIADAFNVPVGFLYDETDIGGLNKDEKNAWHAELVQRESNVEPAPDVTRRIPLISWVQAGSWTDIGATFREEDAEDWFDWPGKFGPRTFALRVVGESMYDPTGPKSYAPGEFIAVDPNIRASNRSMVVVRIDHENKATFKQLLKDENDVFVLRALNPSWPNRIIEMPPGSVIVGVVIGKWVPE